MEASRLSRYLQALRWDHEVASTRYTGLVLTRGLLAALQALRDECSPEYAFPADPQLQAAGHQMLSTIAEQAAAYAELLNRPEPDHPSATRTDMF
jgi:hypothetical protein